jgi:hypothetical protein
LTIDIDRRQYQMFLSCMYILFDSERFLEICGILKERLKANWRDPDGNQYWRRQFCMCVKQLNCEKMRH